jgi:ATP-dependent protease ClpP protease subunit
LASTTRIRKSLLGDFALDNWHNHRVDREARTIFVGGDPHIEGDDMEGRSTEPGVEHHMADRLDLNLHVLENISQEPITILMASCGGNWEEGMQMAGSLVTSRCPITIIGMKHCRSMTSIIPLFADKFYMRPPANYMIHHGYAAFEGLAGGELQSWVEECADSRDMMLRTYVARLKEQGKFSRTHPAKLRTMLEQKMDKKVDVYFTTDEAVEWGFADGVWTGVEQKAKRINKPRRTRMMEVLRKKRNINFKGVL